jgi:2-dehydro-3-deoxygluconokinase
MLAGEPTALSDAATDAVDARPRIVGLGEAMVRLTPPDRRLLEQSETLEMSVGGAELNVLITASAFGFPTRWITRLPANPLGRFITRHARSYGVEVVARLEVDGRAGLYFIESGAPPRPTEILYDRANSAASRIAPDEFDWPDTLQGAGVAHVSGITCALGSGALAAAQALFRCARQLGIRTSFDCNYRSHLWSKEHAAKAFREVLPLVDVLFVSPYDLALLSGREGDPDELAGEIVNTFGTDLIVVRERWDLGPDIVGVSVRVHGYDKSLARAEGQVVDEIGAGDAAAGAFLVSMLGGAQPSQSCTVGSGAYARQLTVPGDAWAGDINGLTDHAGLRRRVLR